MINEILSKTFYYNRVLDYLIAVGIIIGSFVFLRIIICIILKRLKKFAEKTATSLDDFIIMIIHKFVIPLLYVGSIYLGLKYLTFPDYITKIVNIVTLSLVTIFVIRIVISLLEYFLRNYWLKNESMEAVSGTIKVLLPAIRIVVWVIGVVFLLSNLGFDISAMIAGLGISGVAIALASQAIFKDIFNYFVILFDKPFVAGDYVVVGDFMGTIEHIGLKSTRITSLSGEQIIMSNSDMAESRMRNYKRMATRRISFKIGVTYETGLDKLKEIPQLIEQIISSVENAKFDRSHFSQYGDFSLNFEIVYYVLSRDYAMYMDVQQEINYKLKDEFDRRGIEFAYPTQTLFVSKVNG